MPSIALSLSLFAQAAPQAAEMPWHEQGWFTAVLALIVIVVPFLLGQMLAKSLRMNEYSWRIGLVLFSVIAGSAICWLGWPPRLGIDLSGGVILVYEVDPTKAGDYVGTVEDRVRKQLQEISDVRATVTRTEGDKIEVAFPETSPAVIRRVENAVSNVGLDDINASLAIEARTVADGKQVLRFAARQQSSLGKEDMDKMVGSIGKRVNPGGQKEVTVRAMGGDRVEVIIPRVDQAEIDLIKKTISTAGALKFRILANRQVRDDQPFIELAEQSEARQVKAGNEVKAEWVPVDPNNFKDFGPNVVVREPKPGEREVLVIDDDFDVLIGDNHGKLTRANSSFDPDTGGPCVEFAFDSQGAALFGELTGAHLPDPNSGLSYSLGVLLDDKLMTAPTIQSRISSRGQITGNFTREDVKSLVDVLNAGSLPAALNKIPVAQYTSSAQLGQDTIKAGAYAMMISTGAILVFMLVYYRFAGMVADMAVLLNVLLVLALLILIKAHLTLAGVAGLVLSVGMSVDANVLIYERMREEMERGSALRMAIRNGFSRAMSTIVDSNLTTLLVGIVLYVIGTDQLRGFATTLILGLMLNLFTAVYCARLVFDIAERRRWITDLKMLKLFGRPNFDYLKMAKPAIVASVLIIAVGLAGAVHRGDGLFGIDFTGGSAVQVVFDESIDIAEVRKAVIASPDLPDASVSSVVSGDRAERDTQFNINTSNSDIRAVEAKIEELFPGKLKTQSMEYTVAAAMPSSAATEPTSSAIESSKSTEEKAGEKAGEKADEKTRETGDASKKTGMIPHRRSNLPEAEGLLALDSPDAMLLAQADTKTEQTKSAGDANQATELKNPETPKTDSAKTEDQRSTSPNTDSTSTTPPAEQKKPAATDANLTAAELTFPDGITQEALDATLRTAAKQLEFDDVFQIDPTTDADFTPGSRRAIVKWTVKSSHSPEQMERLLKSVQEELAATPIFPSANSIGGKVAGDTKVLAGYALFVSNLLIIIYVWVRFQNLVFGIAAVAALVHDVLIAVAALALSYWLAPFLGFLQVDQFKISLDVVAALLTIVGFSINDTIVIFDRIREVRGKSPELTAGIINRALNETLSRTILTSGTVFIVTLILYAAGGEGIHPFAFTMLIGVIAGSYSSLFIAAPLALWMQRKPARGVGRQYPTGAVTASGAT
jgi:SecD/SecF fusion protein